MTAAATVSRGRMPPDKAWQPLRVLTFYRVILAGLLSVLFFTLREHDPFNAALPGLFSTTLLSYLAFSLIVGFATRMHWPSYEVQALLQILADIGAIALLMHATGGVTSAFTALLVIAVATGALVLPGRLAYLFAAVATLAILFETGLANLSETSAGAGTITRAGLMGAVLFATAALAQVLVLRVRESESLARQRGIDLANLQQLNQYVIQQLQSGVLVVDADHRVRLANDTARQLLKLDSRNDARLEQVLPELARQLELWQRDSTWQPEPIQSPVTGTALLPRISRVATAHGSGALIFLEDSARLARQSQQLKLASLGRLTASIAHEIRNPLGAISHAAQLLAESEQLNPGDRRLTEIIGNHTRRLNSVIENVLQLSRRSASQPQALELAQWLRQFRDELVESERLAAERLSIDVEPDDISIEVDAGHLHQLLTNLCQNAFRHAGEAGMVILQARRSDAGIVRLDVTDNGPGIEPAVAEQMFEPFFTTAGSGTGLGLYIARELCEINRASLTYHPVSGGGSCFRMQFAVEPNV
ncbi:MAG: ATP-binding protein [Thiogranum sp.]|nr:ATP-binding protein [Thiogranum sp.]